MVADNIGSQHILGVSAAYYRVTAQGNYSEADAADLIHQIIDGVAYLHKKGGRRQPTSNEEATCALQLIFRHSLPLRMNAQVLCTVT